MGNHEDDIFNPDGFRRVHPFGPFINRDHFEILATTNSDIIVAGVIFGLSMLFAILAAYFAVQQTRNARKPLRSVYVWMIWIELVACIAIAIECMLYLLYVINPSFYFFMSILFLWSIQIHLLLQIIINRIRVILHDRAKGRAMVIGVALFILCINISVFCIWIPARLQISQRYIHINSIWDRTEKVIYLVVDGCLNWYFIRIVKKNLVSNGLQKYDRLVRVNLRLIVVSLLMDVLIIGAMSIPNGFLYTLFHPLAFLIKLNIEMAMASLIRRIALDNQNQNNSFLTTTNSFASDRENPHSTRRHRRWIHSLMEPIRWSKPQASQEDGIVKTETFSVTSRRRSQLSTYLFKTTSQKNTRRDSLSLEAVSLRSGDLLVSGSSTEEEQQWNGVISHNHVVVAPPPPAATRSPDRS